MAVNQAHLGWELGFPYLQKQLYDYYGDKRIIANNYDAFIKTNELFAVKSDDNLFYWDISDHEALDTKPESFSCICILLSSCYNWRKNLPAFLNKKKIR